MAHGSSKAVITALLANAILTVLKFIAAVLTHSASMMNAVLPGLTAFFLGAVNMRYFAYVRDHEAEAAFADLVGQHQEVKRYRDLCSIIDDRHTILVAEI